MRKHYSGFNPKLETIEKITIPDEDLIGWLQSLKGLDRQFIDKMLSSKNERYRKEFLRRAMDFFKSSGDFSEFVTRREQELGKAIPESEIPELFEEFRHEIEEAFKRAGYFG
ncbi:MAG: hypothetical protein M1383_01825 [Patescibacteria group bacterium]|nr:hypothetical protein [Patescibacteria group bacterium]